MKRSVPLQARTPLTRRTPLRAVAGLSRKSQPLRGTGAPTCWPRTVMRQRATGETFPPAVAALLDARDISLPWRERCCQRCGATRDLHRHHRRGKDMGGSGNRAHAHCACNGVLACLRCHGWIHAHPERARAEGWIVSQAVDEPGTVSVMRFTEAGGGASQYPDCKGNWLSELPSEPGRRAA